MVFASCDQSFIGLNKMVKFCERAKGKVHPKKIILSPFTHPHFSPVEHILRSISLLLLFHKTKVNINQNCSVPNILLNIFFCNPRKKECHLALEQHEGEYMTAELLNRTNVHILQVGGTISIQL